MIGGNVRLRLHGDVVRIEVDCSSFERIVALSHELMETLKNMVFLYVTLDLEGFRSGSMDVHIK